MTSLLRDMILQALTNAGGAAYLERQARHPTALLTMVGKVLPFQVKEAAADPIVPKPVIHVHVPWHEDELSGSSSEQ
jgi:hypothetical protein